MTTPADRPDASAAFLHVRIDEAYLDAVNSSPTENLGDYIWKTFREEYFAALDGDIRKNVIGASSGSGPIGILAALREDAPGWKPAREGTDPLTAPTEQPDALTAWVRAEQRILWGRLNEDIRSAIDGVWSTDASNVACRIVSAARLVGPTPIDEVPWRLSAGGVYEAVLRAGGIEPALPDEQEWRRLDELMARHGTTRASAGPAMAATVAAIVADAGWIASNAEDH